MCKPFGERGKMMRNKKVFGTAAVALAVTAAVAGCGGVTVPNSSNSGSKSTSSNGGTAKKQYSIAFVPKLQGIPYFTAMDQGGQKAAQKFGVKWIYQGGTTADVGSQSEIVSSLINQGVNAIGVSANSPTALNPLAAQATKKGEVFYASDSNVTSPNSKLFVNQADPKDLGTEVMDIAGQEMGGKGQLAIVSAGSTATNLNTWIQYMKQEAKAKYPNIQILPIQYAGEDVTGATQITSKILSAYPNVKGFIGVASTIPPGIAQAVQEAGKSGKVAITGITDPNSVRQYVKDGTIKKVVLWNPVNLGYLTVWGVLQVLEGHKFQTWNTVPGLSQKVEYFPSQHELLLGKPLVIDKSNINLNF
jgi:rhamnose transport system substrate-binding protein